MESGISVFRFHASEQNTYPKDIYSDFLPGIFSFSLHVAIARKPGGPADVVKFCKTSEEVRGGKSSYFFAHNATSSRA